MEPQSASDLLTSDEVAKICRTTAPTVRYWHHIGKGPQSLKVGRRRLYLKADVEAWLSAARDNRQSA